MDVRPEHLARSDSFRANETELKSVIPDNMPVKLDLGCAFRKPDGYWGTDVKPFRGVDQVFDHGVFPWPLPHNQFEEVRVWHIIHLLPDTEKVMEEIWKVSKNGAKVIIGVPYYMSVNAFGDRPKSFFTENTFNIFTEKTWYQEESAKMTCARFTIEKLELRTTGKFRKWLPFKNFLHHFLWNIYDEMEVVLRVEK